MKLNTHQDGLEVAPLLDENRIVAVIPSIAKWNKRDDVRDVQVEELHVQPSSSGEHAYLVVLTTIYSAAGGEQVWACSCPQWHYRESGDVPAESGECKHIVASGSKAKRAEADEDQVTLGGE